MKDKEDVRWEYKVVALPPERIAGDTPGLELDLNELGSANWELITVLPQEDGARNGVTAVFKRPCTSSLW